jgi:hypothetical protein
MDRSILDIIADFALWKGDTYRLASLIAEQQKELDRQILIDSGFPLASGFL